ncbi:hypothetical protein M406DRAFT_339952 [Cryphonectria parasitica EP155]|uniref:FAD-binding FR-type domain-containing protein n=1 Tax=Cryphonectria parasitica (strain ATCC 38755 / EP155) TaxID=660469 RepID=A0A9P4Y0B3_CRYP1|nr:uncharacterized protein M406DRAFT_339952 [Cryphonectria parasitica EP155]KAF3764323.1 hypothetical protein M406DRAFT_339952 [Cryphonectria parasitica EP155]
MYQWNPQKTPVSNSCLDNFPPEQRAYLRKLIDCLLYGRILVQYYNYVLLAILAALTVLHVLERRRCRRRCRPRDTTRQSTSRLIASKPREETRGLVTTTASSSSSSSSVSSSSSSSFSSSSSTSPIPSPPLAAKDAHIDIERVPLLGSHRTRPRPSPFTRLFSRLRQWLEYQPPPLPVINRTLPSNATSLFILAWFSINIFFLLFAIPLQLDYFFCLATRAGDVFVVNLPILYLLAAKNQPLKLLTGASYEALNIFHRRIGEWMCLVALVHSVGVLLWRFVLEPEWLHRKTDLLEYLTHPLVLRGAVALVSYELLFFTSLGSFRRRWYEMFLASHVVLQIVALLFLYLHFFTARPYVLVALAIFVTDRIVWRVGLKSATVDADLRVLPDGETIFLSAEWDRPLPRSSSSRWRSLWPRQSIRHGWKPTDHVFLSVPTLGLTHRLQAHPFTIASPAPLPPTSQDGGDVNNAESVHHAQPVSLRLLIRAHEGFTADLLCCAHRHRSVRVRLDGPYGSSHALDMLQAADNAILVAGGSGIAVTLPLVWALLQEEAQIPWGSGTGNHVVGDGDKDAPDLGMTTRKKRRRTVRMLWIIHSEEHRAWVPRATLDELISAGLELVIPRPTSVGGRPDVVGIVEAWAEGSCSEAESAVVVSGPDGLNRTVRNTCAAAIGRGANVRLAVEKFGW